MATPKHMRIVFRGTIVGTPEIWSISLKFDTDTPLGPDANVGDVQADGVRDACEAFFNNARFTSALQLEEWRAYVIESDGEAHDNVRQELFETGDFIRGTAGIWHVPQVAVVITSVAENRGPARYGRFYLPQVAFGPDATDHRLSVTNATGLVEAASTFCKSVSGAIDALGVSTNRPLVNISTIGTGTKQVVEHLNCGRVFDTQRRRRNAMLEEPVSTGHIDW